MEHPQRRWFLTHYRIPPNDPRYLSLTDEEILFDFYTVEALKREARVETPAAPDVPAPVSPVPMPEGAEPRQSSWVVQADEDEFKAWCREIGARR